jgi:uncharacterized membrane protein
VGLTEGVVFSKKCNLLWILLASNLFHLLKPMRHWHPILLLNRWKVRFTITGSHINILIFGYSLGMLGGINNALFLQSLGGFLALLVFIPLLRWTFDSPSVKAERARRREIKKSLRRLKRK